MPKARFLAALLGAAGIAGALLLTQPQTLLAGVGQVVQQGTVPWVTTPASGATETVNQGTSPWVVDTTGSGNLDTEVKAPIPTQQSGAAAPVVGCDKSAKYDASDNGLKTIVLGVSSKKIYICGFILATGGTATNLSLTSGTGSDCASTSTAITPAFQLLANDRTGGDTAFWNGLATINAADNLCVNASAGNSHQVMVWYTQQ